MYRPDPRHQPKPAPAQFTFEPVIHSEQVDNDERREDILQDHKFRTQHSPVMQFEPYKAPEHFVMPAKPQKREVPQFEKPKLKMQPANEKKPARKQDERKADKVVPPVAKKSGGGGTPVIIVPPTNEKPKLKNPHKLKETEK